MRLVAITGYGRESDRLEALAAGFDEHMTKPVDLDLVERMLAASAPTACPSAVDVIAGTS